VEAAHKKLFRAWLCLPIQLRAKDFLLYCESLCITKPLARERFVQFCRDIVPYDAAMADVKVFMADVELFSRKLPKWNQSHRGEVSASD
jgi:hypothetical protein